MSEDIWFDHAGNKQNQPLFLTKNTGKQGVMIYNNEFINSKTN